MSRFVPGRRAPITLLCVLAPPVVLLLIVMIWTATAGNAVEDVFRDPLATQGVDGHAGIISTLGLLLWAATAGCCALAAALLRRDRARLEYARYLAGAALLTAALAVDDAFMLHERVLPVMVGIPQVLVMLAWLAAGALYVLRFRRELLAPERLAHAALAFGLFAVSYGVDGLQGVGLAPESALVTLVEDGAKFLGICAWLGYHWLTALDAVVGRAAQPAAVVETEPQLAALRRSA